MKNLSHQSSNFVEMPLIDKIADPPRTVRSIRGLVKRVLSTLSAIALMMGLGVIASPPANANPTGNVCQFGAYVVIGVRGTNAPAGGSPTHDGRVWQSGGYGDQVWPVVSLLRGGSIPAYTVSLNYPAVAFTNSSHYQASVKQGRDTLVNELNWLSTACGNYLPSVILIGHSQGGHVILDALTANFLGNNLTDRARASIRAAVTFGEPTFRPHMSYNAPGAGTGFGLLGRTSLSTNYLRDNYRVWGWGPGSTGQSWVPLIRSYCKTGDQFCQTGTGSNAGAIHNSYTSETVNARNWIDYMLSSMG